MCGRVNFVNRLFMPSAWFESVQILQRFMLKRGDVNVRIMYFAKLLYRFIVWCRSWRERGLGNVLLQSDVGWERVSVEWTCFASNLHPLQFRHQKFHYGFCPFCRLSGLPQENEENTDVLSFYKCRKNYTTSSKNTLLLFSLEALVHLVGENCIMRSFITSIFRQV
jgi:hypothetical protein